MSWSLLGLCVLVSTVTAAGDTLSSDPAPVEFALVGATVIDVADAGRSDRDLVDAVVLVRGGVITAVGSRGSVRVPDGVPIVDVSGKYIVPGLVDGFATLNNQAYANAYLYHGVTTLLAVWGGRRGPLLRDARPGPHMYPLEGIGSQPKPTAELLTEARELHRQGIRVLLLMYALKPDQTHALVQLARELDMGTIGEFGFTSYAQAMQLGVDVFVHHTRYSLELAPRDMAHEVAQRPFSNDLDSPKWRYYLWLSEQPVESDAIAQYSRRLGESQTYLMPTLSLLYLDQPWSRNPWLRPGATTIRPEDVNRPADPETGRHRDSGDVRAAYEAVARHMMLLEPRYRSGGARYLAGSGTDVWGTMPGVSLHQELEGLVRIGLSPREALAAATSNFADAFGWSDLGQIAEGRRADLLVLGADPRESVAHLADIDRVILAGETIDRPPLIGGAPDGTLLEREPVPVADGANAENSSEPDFELERIVYASDGLRVRGYLAKPRGTGPFPSLIYNRGGNREFGALDDTKARRRLGRLVRAGYLVVASQYRGNAGGDAIEEFGGLEVRDILHLVPLLESLPSADATRVGMVGHSRGGLMTYLTLARTDRIAAAVVTGGVSDLMLWKEERPEMESVFEELIPGYVRGRDHQLRSRSPARWADRLSKKTPLLIMHGTSDWRVSPNSVVRMASSLERARHPFRLILLEGANHGLSTHRDEVDRQTKGWLDRFVRDGEPIPVPNPRRH